jgi:hypothetical protein
MSSVTSMMFMTGRAFLPPPNEGTKTLALREAWPHSPIRIFWPFNRWVSAISLLMIRSAHQSL